MLAQVVQPDSEALKDSVPPLQEVVAADATAASELAASHADSDLDADDDDDAEGKLKHKRPSAYLRPLH